MDFALIRLSNDYYRIHFKREETQFLNLANAAGIVVSKLKTSKIVRYCLTLSNLQDKVL